MQDEDDEPERVTAESYGSLNTSKAFDQCWLIRVPHKLYEEWKELPEGTDLGELVFCKGDKANVKPSLSIQVAESSISSTTNVPFQYSLQAMTKKMPVMHPFVRNPHTGRCDVLGNISRTANLQAAQTDGKYRAMLKDRLAATTLRDTGFVKAIGNPATVVSSAAAPHNKKRSFGNAVLEFGKKKLEAQDASKVQVGTSTAKKARQFAPNESVRSVLFALFGMQRYWTAKDLKIAAVQRGFDVTKRAEAEMRDLLRSELAIYHRSGDHKNHWELKEEFRQSDAGDS